MKILLLQVQNLSIAKYYCTIKTDFFLKIFKIFFEKKNMFLVVCKLENTKMIKQFKNLAFVSFQRLISKLQHNIFYGHNLYS